MGYKRGDFYDCEYDVELMLKTREIETLKKEETKKENKQKKVANKKEDRTKTKDIGATNRKREVENNVGNN